MPPYNIRDQGAFENLDKKHPLWKENDPAEGTMAFMMKYDCSNYNELQELLNKKS